MQEVTKVEIDVPVWAQGGRINEREFYLQFSRKHNLAWMNGCFFGEQGMVPEEQVRKWVFDMLENYFCFDLVPKTNKLLEAMKLYYQKEKLINDSSQVCIHVANGTYLLMKEELSDAMYPCRCRLPVRYNPGAPRPVRWLKFLSQLLYPEDIPTLQEYLGYCLVPVNYAQKMLLILGKGGEGKSRIGIVLHALMGDAMCNGSLLKLENSQFARADLQNRLLMVDDDLQLAALKTTGYLKTIITAEQPLDLERKGEQSYQGRIYCRLMAFGNGNLQSLYDRSHGFFRRQIILTTRDRPMDRVDDPFLADRLKQETEGILLWALEGLRRLTENNMCFTISTRARWNLDEAVLEGNNILAFLSSEGYIRFGQNTMITSRRLYSVYTEWCDDNMMVPLTSKSFSSWIISNCGRLNITYAHDIPGGSGRMVRGFRGITTALGWGA